MRRRREGGRQNGRQGGRNDVPFQLTPHILSTAHGADIDEVLPAPVLIPPVLLVGVVGIEESEVVAIDVRELKEKRRGKGEGGKEGGREGERGQVLFVAFPEFFYLHLPSFPPAFAVPAPWPHLPASLPPWDA